MHVRRAIEMHHDMRHVGLLRLIHGRSLALWRLLDLSMSPPSSRVASDVNPPGFWRHIRIEQILWIECIIGGSMMYPAHGMALRGHPERTRATAVVSHAGGHSRVLGNSQNGVQNLPGDHDAGDTIAPSRRQELVLMRADTCHLSSLRIRARLIHAMASYLRPIIDLMFVEAAT